MNVLHNSELTATARMLRKNMTHEECKLWFEFLKQLSVPVKRQKIIGEYIVDFYIPAGKIVIEVDGSQHYEQPQKQKDVARDADLEGIGLKVLRYSNFDVNQNFEAVCDDIVHHLKERVPSP